MIEYKVYRMNNVNEDLQNILDKHGAEGWELVLIHPHLPMLNIVFKRAPKAAI